MKHKATKVPEQGGNNKSMEKKNISTYPTYVHVSVFIKMANYQIM